MTRGQVFDLKDPAVERVYHTTAPEIHVRFSEPVDTSTGEFELRDSAGRLVPFTQITEPAGRLVRLELDPAEFSPGASYSLNLLGDFNDRAGNTLPADTRREFGFDAADSALLIYLRAVDDPDPTELSFFSPYLFQGREYDSETGLYYFRARYLDPNLQRFLTPDPLGYQDGPNLYASFQNNPGVYTDPQGTAAIALLPFLAGALAGIGLDYATEYAFSDHDSLSDFYLSGDYSVGRALLHGTVGGLTAGFGAAVASGTKVAGLTGWRAASAVIGGGTVLDTAGDAAVATASGRFEDFRLGRSLVTNGAINGISFGLGARIGRSPAVVEERSLK